MARTAVQVEGQEESLETKKVLGIPYWVATVIVFFLGWIFLYADRTILNPVMGEIQKTFHISKADLGLINSIFFLSYTIMQIPSGVLGDKIGRKIVLLAGFLLFGVFTGVSGLMATAGFGMFLFARFITGIGEGTYYGPQYGLSSEAIPEKYRGLGSAIINSGQAFGISLGLLSSSILTLEVKLPWQTPFYVFAVPTLLTGVLIWCVVKEKKKNSVAAVQSGVEVEEKVPFVSLLKNRNLLATYVTVFCSLYGFFMILTWLPFYLQEYRGLQGGQVGIISSLIPWASIPGALIVSTISDRLNVRKPIALIMLPVAIVAVCATVVIQDYNLLIAALIIYGLFGKLAMDPILISIVANNTPKSGYGTAFSIFNCVGMLSSIVAPYVTGYISDQTGSMEAGFYLAAVLLIVAFISMFFVQEKKPLKIVLA